MVKRLIIVAGLLLASNAGAQRLCLSETTGLVVCPEPAMTRVIPPRPGICPPDAPRMGPCAAASEAPGPTDAAGSIQAKFGQCATDEFGRVKFDGLGRAMCAGGCGFGR